MYQMKLALLVFLGFNVAGTTAQAATCTPQSFSSCRDLNRDMINFYNSTPDKRNRRMPHMTKLKQAEAILNENGLQNFWDFRRDVFVAGKPAMKELIYQEWIRGQSDGMPWLPISWYVHDGWILYQLNAFKPSYESALSQVPRPWSDDNLFLTYLFNGVIPHTDSSNFATKVRQDAINLAHLDSGFADLRQEIHEEPSLRTLKRLDEYIASTSNSDFKARAKEMRVEMEHLFGFGDVKEFLKLYEVSSHNLDKAFSEYLEVLPKLESANSAKDVTKLLESGSVVSALKEISKGAKEISDKARAAQITQCLNDSSINCTFEYLDTLGQLQRMTFSLGNQFVGKIREYRVPFSIKDFIEISSPLVQANVAIGLMRPNILEKFEAAATQPVLSQGAAQALIVDLETEVGNMIGDFRGLFLPYIEKYKMFTPIAERFIDDTLRSTATLPLSNLTADMKRAILAEKGVSLFINDKAYSGDFMVLNPGIAKGVLVLPEESEIQKPGYAWKADKIYVLPKTPAEIYKVAGIITADSGSMISHVQLLAANHGIPNVYASANLLSNLSEYKDKEVLIISLPNGEAQIKLWAKATPAEIKVYEEYNKLRTKNKVTLVKPSKLDQMNYPLRLEQLRMSDAGHVAGGKACGQGELSTIFKDTVPHAIVLPFGVYYKTMVQNGIYAEIQKAFQDPNILKDSDKRLEAMARIQGLIKNAKFSDELLGQLKKLLDKKPFIDNKDKPRGVFVRSDTNAEDLPGFVGAGLNLTVPNVVGFDNIVQAIKDVWASPFTEKAFTWREDLITNPWDIFPSVVIQLALPSQVAGVMVVGDPKSDGDIEDTVILAANQGIGITVVSGEYSPEEVSVSRKKKAVTLLRRARAATRKVLNPMGGISERDVTAQEGLLPESVALELAKMGDEIQKHMLKKYKTKGKWDIEYGVLNGKVILFQLRPFDGNKIVKDVGSLNTLRKSTEVVNVNYDSEIRRFYLPKN